MNILYKLDLIQNIKSGWANHGATTQKSTSIKVADESGRAAGVFI